MSDQPFTPAQPSHEDIARYEANLDRWRAERAILHCEPEQHQFDYDLVTALAFLAPRDVFDRAVRCAQSVQKTRITLAVFEQVLTDRINEASSREAQP